MFCIRAIKCKRALSPRSPLAYLTIEASWRYGARTARRTAHTAQTPRGGLPGHTKRNKTRLTASVVARSRSEVFAEVRGSMAHEGSRHNRQRTARRGALPAQTGRISAAHKRDRNGGADDGVSRGCGPHACPGRWPGCCCTPPRRRTPHCATRRRRRTPALTRGPRAAANGGGGEADGGSRSGDGGRGWWPRGDRGGGAARAAATRHGRR